MMHGTIDPAFPHAAGEHDGRSRFVRMIVKRKWLAVVVLPTLLLALYYWGVASDQYESEAHILVRNSQMPSSAPSGIGQALSLVGGGATASPDIASVSDYLSSHDVVDALRRSGDLVAIFRRPEADLLSKLTPADPTPERLLRYYRRHVSVKLNVDTGITTIQVRTFRPEDSFRLVNALLALGEQRVNTLNRRAYEDSLRLARQQLGEAEELSSRSQTALTSFRQGRRNIDPLATGQAQIQVVSNLQATLAQARAQRAAMTGALSASSPQVRALDARIAALSAQVGAESARLAGGGDAIATNVGDYQGLQLRQQFAAKRYDDAAAALQRAREQAVRQQLFIVRVVEPNVPVKALYPQRLRIVGTALAVLLICYGLGWLIAAGVREHAS